MQKKSLLAFLLLFVFFLGQVPPFFNTAEAKSVITISTETLNVRVGPGLDYDVIQKVQNGDTFPLVTEEGDWYQIELSSGKTGWVVNWLASKSTDAESRSRKEQPKQTNIGVITTDSLRVRSGPGTTFQALGSLNKGDEVIILSEQDGWVEIRFLNKKAWISSEYIKVGKATPQTSDSPEEKDDSKNNPSGYVGTITAASLNVRETGSFNGKIIGTVSKGQAFKIVEEKNHWAKIEYKPDKFGWVGSWYLEEASPSSASKEAVKNSSVTILHKGTNIRTSPSLNADVIDRANTGEKFPILKLENDWYEIRLKNGKSGYVAGWIVTVNGGAPQVQKSTTEPSLKNKLIMIDPGHGGKDNGATGYSGSLEKELTMWTAQMLYDKLRAAGANPILTRKNNHFVSLTSRINMAHYQDADAFISVHYDSILEQMVTGMTSYFYYPYQKSLAYEVHQSIQAHTGIKDRGVRFGDYYVLRENRQNATLLELGYLSNPAEEALLSSEQYQDQVTTGIVKGLANYFKKY